MDLSEHGLTLTHADLAHLIGSTRETTSLMLNEIRREGYIEYQRRKYVVYAAKIRELLDEE